MLLLAVVLALLGTGEGSGPRSVWLDTQGRFLVSWMSDGTSITFTVQARTTGWVGLGFSPNGGMGGADLIVAGVRDGKGYLYDRHSESNGWPELDTKSDYTLLSAAENATHTTLRFTRLLDTCDPQDWKITKDTVRLIWAMHGQDAESENLFQKHTYTERGAKSVILLLDAPYDDSPDALPRDTKIIELRPNNATFPTLIPRAKSRFQVHLPNDYNSLYHCSIHQLPVVGKHEMIKYGVALQPGNERFVHHIVLYHCLHDMSQYVGKGEPCFDLSRKDLGKESPMMICSSRYLAGWAVGAGDVTFPQDMGFPVMEEGSSPFVMLEMHYDNPAMVKDIVDNSGIRVWLTPTPRPVEVGNIILGLGVASKDFFIPPRQTNFTYRSMCGPKCTEKFPREGVKIMNVFPHAHLTGRAVRLRQIRDGVELPPIFIDNHYDFNYQEQRLIVPNPTILPGDVLITECDFETMDRDSTTFAGWRSADEMCIIFANFYPKLPDSMVACMGGPIPKVYGDSMGAQKAEGAEDWERVNGPLGSNLTFRDYVNRYFPLNDPAMRNKTEKLVADNLAGTYYNLCGGQDKSTDVKEAEREIRLRVKRQEGEGPPAIEKLKYDFDMGPLQLPRTPFLPPSSCSGAPASPSPLGVEGSNSRGVGGQARGGWGSGAAQRPEATAQLDSNFRPNDLPYDHEVWLDKDRRVYVHWILNDDSTITFEAHVETRGWFGLGFSPNGGMKNADMIVAWIDAQGHPQLSDRHGTSNGFPPVDDHQDYTLLGGMRNDTHVVVKFSRRRVTCDPQDLPIGVTLLSNPLLLGGMRNDTHVVVKFSRRRVTCDPQDLPIRVTLLSNPLLLGGMRNDTHVVVKFSRRRVTCDPQDLPIGVTLLSNPLLLGGMRNDTHVVVKFSRRRVTCDPQDLPIGVTLLSNPLLLGGMRNDTHVVVKFSRRRVTCDPQDLPIGVTLLSNPLLLGGMRNDTHVVVKFSRRRVTCDPQDLPIGVTLLSNPLLLGGMRNDTHVVVKFSRRRVTCDPQDLPIRVTLLSNPLLLGGMRNDTHVVVKFSRRRVTCDPQDLPIGVTLLSNPLLLGGMRNDTHVVVKFSRRRVTCDPQDLPIGDDTMRMIWALNDEMPTGPDSFAMHSNRNRGSRSVYMTEIPGEISEDLARELADPNLLTLQFRSNNTQIPNDYHTLYWCQIFELEPNRPHHLIKFEPWIQPGNEPYVHHMILYSCDKKLDMGEFVGKGEPCFARPANGHGRGAFSPMYQCTSKYLAGWAVGGESHTFPDGVGYPFFESDGERFLMLEMHYDNSAYDQRKALRVRHIRDGVELPPLMEDNAYDFNYQEMRNKKKPVKILPVSLLGHSSFVNQGGFSTSEEMCIAFMEYWPRQDMSTFCMSQPDPKTLFGHLGADPEMVDEEKHDIEGLDPVAWVEKNLEPSKWGGNKSGAQRYEAAKALQKIVKDELHIAMCMTLEAADALKDEEAEREGKRAVKLAEAKKGKALKFKYIPVEPVGFLRQPYQAPNECANRRLAPAGRGGAENGVSVAGPSVTLFTLLLILRSIHT